MGLWLHLGLKKRREAMLIFLELVEGFRNENGVLEQMQMAYFHWGLLNLPKCKLHLNRKMWDKACTSLPPNYYSSAAAVSYAYISERWQWQCLEWQSNSKKGLLFFFSCSLKQRSYSTNSQKYAYEKSLSQETACVIPEDNQNFCRSWWLVSWVTTGKAAINFLLFPTPTAPGMFTTAVGLPFLLSLQFCTVLPLYTLSFSRSWKALLTCSGKNLL